MKKFRFPLWLKSLIVLILSVLIVSIVAIVYSATTLNSITREHYMEHSVELADSLALYLDKDDVKELRNAVQTKYDSLDDDAKVDNSAWDEPEWEEYLSNYEFVLEMDCYKRIMDQLAAFHKANHARYTCLTYADFDDHVVIYLADDAEEEERCLPGSFDQFTENDYGIYDHPYEGFLPEITNMPEYGYLASTGRPVVDENNVIIGFVIIDLSMDEIVSIENHRTLILGLVLGGLSIISVMAGFLLVSFLIVHPIRRLTKVANEYTHGSSDQLNKFENIDIHSRDEIEDLANSMKKMESDLNGYIQDLLNAKKKTAELNYLVVKDALTGVGNKRSYFFVEEKLNEEIKQGKAKFGIVMIDLNNLKIINDTEGHEKGDEVIVNLAKSIQTTFVGSNVYRIGGDEFVVVVLDQDLSKMNKCESEFTKMVKNAAIGSATYDSKQDLNVEDTFKRADRKMYERKKQMKESE